MVKQFKIILRSFNDEKGAQELFKVKLKSMNLNSLNSESQNKVLEELAINFDLKEIFSKINDFIKNPDDANVNVLKLIKYEMVYYLFKKGILKEKSTLSTLNEMLSNYDTLVKEKGFLDILAQFTLALGEKNTFIKIFTQKKTQTDLTNAPINDLMYTKKYQDIINTFYTYIKINTNKCIFNEFERIINFYFWYFSKKDIKLINECFVIKDISNIKEQISILEESNNVISDILNLFEYIKVNSGRNLNSFKSVLLGHLMIYHNHINYIKEFNDDIQ